MAMVVGVVREYPQLLHLMVSMSLFAMGLVVGFLPAFDIIVATLCPGSDQCPEALFLSSFKSVVGGISGMLVAPLLGSLSDKYGRKPFLVGCTLLISLPVLVMVLVKHTRSGIYAYFAAETVAASVGGGGAGWVVFFFAYVADVVPDREGYRLGAFGAVSGMIMLGFVFGPLLARVIPEDYCFLFSLLLCLISSVYMLLFLPESLPSYKLLVRSRPGLGSFRLPSWATRAGGKGTADGAKTAAAAATPDAALEASLAPFSAPVGDDGARPETHNFESGEITNNDGDPSQSHPTAPGTPATSSSPVDSSGTASLRPPPTSGRGPHLVRSRSALREVVSMFGSSTGLGLLMFMAFLHSFADNGQTQNMFYVFKALFHWDKDNFAIFTFGIGCIAIVSQLVVLPFVAPRVSVRPLLLFSLFVSAFHTILYGWAWAEWVVYSALSLSLITSLIGPSLSNVVSKRAGPSEQGKLQGTVAGVTSLAGVLAPLIINPLTALFLSDKAPFHAPGFGIFVAGLCDLAAFFLLLCYPSITSPSRLAPIAEEEEKVEVQVPTETTPLLTSN